jgi:polar amino acid transport system substrate-binding protein
VKLAIAIAAGALIASGPAVALRIVTNEIEPPELSKPAGMATDTVREMLRRAKLGSDIEVTGSTNPQLQAAAQRDACAYPLSRVAGAGNFRWIGPIASWRWGLYGLTGFTGQITSLKEAGPYRVGLVRGDGRIAILRQHGVSRIVEAEWNKYLPGQLTLKRDEPGKIDLWLMSLVGAKRVAAGSKVEVQLAYIGGEHESYLVCNLRTARELLKPLADALRAMRADGTYDRIMKAHESR